MSLVVNDACLLIDLIDIDLFDEFLQLGFQAYVTTSVLAKLDDPEYKSPVMDGVRSGALEIYSLTSKDQDEITALMETYSSRLSEPDCSCLHLAMKIKATILTCEKILTSTARDLKLKVHGSLWVLDQLIASSVITNKTARRKLEKLMSINPRLPKKECQKRLKLWR
jgi:predicted nucleic acid-binding protein